jgi:arylsulfatase A-like enzyme
MKALVLVPSGLHVGYIGCYGNEWVQTPNLDRLAAEGIVFDQHYADQPDAAGAQRAWQTACYRFPYATAQEEAAYPEPVSLFPLLAGGGVRTLSISDNKVSRDEVPSALARALDHLASCSRWLLRLDLGVLLPPWNIPDEFRSYYSTSGHDQNEGGSSSLSEESEATEEVACLELQNQYAAAVTHLDTVVGQLLGEIEQRGLSNDVLVLVTTEHGQKLGEDTARLGSRLSLHEELIHIPLILRLPEKAEAGRRISAFTQSLDVVPTLFEVFGVQLPAVHGESLLPLARGQRNQIREYACAGLRTGDAIEWALRSPHWSFLLPMSSPSFDSPAESELYVKPDDRWEVNNVSHVNLELTERLKQTLGEFVDATRRPGPLQAPKLPDLRLETAEEKQDRTTESAERSIHP